MLTVREGGGEWRKELRLLAHRCGLYGAAISLAVKRAQWHIPLYVSMLRYAATGRQQT